MKFRRSLVWGGMAVGTVGVAYAVQSFLPQQLVADHYVQPSGKLLKTATYPEIEVSFLRCGSVTLPECLAVRGSFSCMPRVITYSAVLIRHPQATFLFDTGLSTDIPLFLLDQSWYFKQTLGKFKLERPLYQHLQQRGLPANQLDFVLLSHLHWDHVAGLPDLPGVPLRINRLEYTAAWQGLFAQNDGLVSRLMGKNPVDLFDCAGPAYEGFRSSFDLLGDGSLIVVPLPGHTLGQVGLFVNRSNGSRLFLVADAAFVAENYLLPATSHPFLWSQVTIDPKLARQTLVDVHHFSLRHPEVPIIPHHDARMQEAFALVQL
ncbi:MBL fold metallo-hydrolase [Tengunoibacter tsumagoiensis]|uniref:Metallo-beta-lactamase domain-containing protein n=1 Tax=Tengunoibacter tsumagoiensis TaxID=2014871 RepID=A0A401ZXB9_9CHLR|nr:MBL fold metallo-hydrolase [Tengunoibacter tsumagoiensis]GCE11494.1 hypothetical protein KTT_13530 [Tengunoibacter tsumagoiensis]